MSYLVDDDKIVRLIEAISTTCDVAPGDAFFRYGRAAFIDSIIRLGHEGLVSADNAVRSIIRQVGEDFLDQKDAILMSVRWPKVAQALHKYWKTSMNIPQFNRCNKNLLRDIGCRESFHPKERQKEICFIRDEQGYNDMKGYFSREKLVILTIRPNKDPRSFSPLPSCITFRAPGLDLFGFFPHKIDASLLNNLLELLGSKNLFVCEPEATRKALNMDQKDFRHVHAGAVAMKYGFGRSNDAIASYVWDHRFCILTKEEWVSDPLTREQEVHIAYELNLLDGLVGKVGLSVVEGLVK